MKRISCFGIFIFALCLFPSCSKDILKTYDKRIIGNWVISDIDGYGFGGYSLAFSEDEKFSFQDNGQLTFTSANEVYQGSWDIRKIVRDDNTTQSLQITAVNFGSQAVRTEYFNDLQFTTSNRFKAFINNGTKVYVYHFVRD
jgi:hypothetical protein